MLSFGVVPQSWRCLLAPLVYDGFNVHFVHCEREQSRLILGGFVFYKVLGSGSMSSVRFFKGLIIKSQ